MKIENNAKITKRGNETFLYVPQLNKKVRLSQEDIDQWAAEKTRLMELAKKKAEIRKRGGETYLYVRKLDKEMRFNSYGRQDVLHKLGKHVEELTQKEVEQLAKDFD